MQRDRRPQPATRCEVLVVEHVARTQLGFRRRARQSLLFATNASGGRVRAVPLSVLERTSSAGAVAAARRASRSLPVGQTPNCSDHHNPGVVSSARSTGSGWLPASPIRWEAGGVSVQVASRPGIQRLVEYAQPQDLQQTYPAVADSVRAARRALTRFAVGAGASAEQVEAVRLAASEALTNAVKHAYPDSEGSVQVTAAVVCGELCVLIVDDGS